MDTLFVACLGGSGARVASSLIHLVSAGVFDNCNELHILLVDPHIEHKNIQDAIQKAKEYNALQKAFNPDGKASLFKVKLTVDFWQIRPKTDNLLGWVSGLKDTNLNILASFTLEDRKCDKTSDVKSAENLMKLLYTKQERENIHVFSNGYNARPSIGAAFCTSAIEFNKRRRNTTDTYIEFRTKIANKLANGNVHLVLVGSLFGGTGAACLSALATDFKAVNEENIYKTELHVSGVFMLPYFSFRVRTDGSGIVINYHNFHQSTANALTYYELFRVTNGYFHSTYVVGHDEMEERADYNNNNDQNNPCHFVELEAAMSMHHFINDSHDKNSGRVFAKGYKLREKESESESGKESQIDWGSLYNGDELRRKVGKFLVQGMMYTTYLYPHIFSEENKRRIKFIILFLRYTVEEMKDTDDDKKLNDLFNYFADFTDWCIEVATSLHGKQDSTGEEVVASIFNDYPLLRKHPDDGSPGLFELTNLKKYRTLIVENKFDKGNFSAIAKSCKGILGGSPILFQGLRGIIFALRAIQNPSYTIYQTFLESLFDPIKIK